MIPGPMPIPAPLLAVNGATSVSERFWRVGDGLPGSGTLGRFIDWKDSEGVSIFCVKPFEDPASVAIDQAEYETLIAAWEAAVGP